ncbi:MAG TPA: cytochrome c oxidase assembly protein [Acidimicrobiales bacterium]|nr:cytochrome c oxidase assembly protein [Acidimicrobiales bacterium]
MPVKSPSPQPSTLLFSWQHDWMSVVALVVQLAAFGWYLASIRRLQARGRRWSRYKAASFIVGLVVVAYAAEGGVAAYDDSNFTVHIIQHILLMNLAPPLLAIGAPITLALQSSSRRTTTFLLKILHSPPARVLTQPIVALSMGVITMYAYFLTPLYAFSEQHPVFHSYVHLHFLAVGCLFWWPIVGRDVLPRRLSFGVRFLLVFLTIPWNAFLGLAIASVTKPLYAAANTLADTQSGGDVLWGLGEVLTVATLAILFVDWAADEERRAVRADRQLDAALAAARFQAEPEEPAGLGRPGLANWSSGS